MLAAYFLIRSGLRPLLCRPVLGFVVVLDDTPSALGVGCETLRPQGTGPALGGRKPKAPAVPSLGALPRAGRCSPRTPHLIASFVASEHIRLKQLRCRREPINRWHIDRQLRPIGRLTQL